MSQHARRVLFLVVVIATVTAGHYATQLELEAAHDLFRRLYYLPIIVGACWYRLGGGLLTAAAISALFAPHVLFQWGDTPLTDAEQYLEIVMYFVVGGTTGLLSRRGEQQRVELRLANAKIEAAYGQLEQQSLALFQAEEQIRRADRLAMLGELSAVAAHEIRNPLGSIKGTAEIFRDSLGADHRLHDFARILVDETDRLDRILTEFLEFAHPKGADACAAEVSPIVDHVVRLTAERARMCRIAIVTKVPRVLPKAAIPAAALHQVLLNLVLNAIQATGPGGRITVTASVGSARRVPRTVPAGDVRMVHVAVSDDGPGVPAEIRDRIFEPFFTTKHGGTGLGLAICQRIVLGYRGAICVEPTAVRGACFAIELPIAVAEANVLAEVGT